MEEDIERGRLITSKLIVKDKKQKQKLKTKRNNQRVDSERSKMRLKAELGDFIDALINSDKFEESKLTRISGRRVRLLEFDGNFSRQRLSPRQLRAAYGGRVCNRLEP